MHVHRLVGAAGRGRGSGWWRRAEGGGRGGGWWKEPTKTQFTKSVGLFSSRYVPSAAICHQSAEKTRDAEVREWRRTAVMIVMTDGPDPACTAVTVCPSGPDHGSHVRSMLSACLPNAGHCDPALRFSLEREVGRGRG